MRHLTREFLTRIKEGTAGPAEVEEATTHLETCMECRALAASVASKPSSTGRDPLAALLKRRDFEERRAVEALSATAAWAELSRMTRRVQHQTIRLSKACQTLAFVQLATQQIRNAKVLDDAEFIASLALRAIEAMDPERYPAELAPDLRAEVWIEVANARRRAAEWEKAAVALKNATEHMSEGTGDLLIEGHFLSIQASLLFDQGRRDKAVDALELACDIYDDVGDWHSLARSLVQQGVVLTDTEPEKALVVLRRAIPLIPATDSFLLLTAESVRVECLLVLGQVQEAVFQFQRISALREAHRETRVQIRSMFTASKLLEAIGKREAAQGVLEKVIASDLENNFIKDAALDMLSLFGLYVRHESWEKAAQVAVRALQLLEGREQIHELWSQLLKAARLKCLDQQALFEAREYMKVSWTNPVGDVPRIQFKVH